MLDFVRLNTRLQPEDMCGVFLGASCAARMSDKLNWTIAVPAKDPGRDGSNMAVSLSAPNINGYAAHDKSVAYGDSSTFKVVQITDIHFDPYFSPGMK